MSSSRTYKFSTPTATCEIPRDHAFSPQKLTFSSEEICVWFAKNEWWLTFDHGVKAQIPLSLCRRSGCALFLPFNFFPSFTENTTILSMTFHHDQGRHNFETKFPSLSGQMHFCPWITTTLPCHVVDFQRFTDWHETPQSFILGVFFSISLQSYFDKIETPTITLPEFSNDFFFCPATGNELPVSLADPNFANYGALFVMIKRKHSSS